MNKDLADLFSFKDVQKFYDGPLFAASLKSRENYDRILRKAVIYGNAAIVENLISMSENECQLKFRELLMSMALDKDFLGMNHEQKQNHTKIIQILLQNNLAHLGEKGNFWEFSLKLAIDRGRKDTLQVCIKYLFANPAAWEKIGAINPLSFLFQLLKNNLKGQDYQQTAVKFLTILKELGYDNLLENDDCKLISEVKKLASNGLAREQAVRQVIQSDITTKLLEVKGQLNEVKNQINDAKEKLIPFAIQAEMKTKILETKSRLGVQAFMDKYQDAISMWLPQSDSDKLSILENLIQRESTQDNLGVLSYFLNFGKEKWFLNPLNQLTNREMWLILNLMALPNMSHFVLNLVQGAFLEEKELSELLHCLVQRAEQPSALDESRIGLWHLISALSKAYPGNKASWLESSEGMLKQMRALEQP